MCRNMAWWAFGPGCTTWNAFWRFQTTRHGFTWSFYSKCAWALWLTSGQGVHIGLTRVPIDMQSRDRAGDILGPISLSFSEGGRSLPGKDSSLDGLSDAELRELVKEERKAAKSIHAMSTEEWRKTHEADGCVSLWVEEEFNSGSRLVVRLAPLVRCRNWHHCADTCIPVYMVTGTCGNTSTVPNTLAQAGKGDKQCLPCSASDW